MKAQYQGERIQAGFVGESTVKDYLSKHGNVYDSEPIDDLLSDIDCYWDNGQVVERVSIKTQHAALQTGNLCFELAVLWRQRLDADGYQVLEIEHYPKNFIRPKNESWKASWWHTGKANLYVFNVGKCLYFAHHHVLLPYVVQNGWDKVTMNTKRIVNDANQRLHPHENALCGLLSVSKLLQAGVLTEVTL